MVCLGDVTTDDEHAVVGQQGGAGATEGLDASPGVVHHIDRATEVIVEGGLPRHHGAGLVVHGRDPVSVSPDRAPARVVVHGDTDVVTEAVQLGVQRDGRGDRPAALEDATLGVDPHDVGGGDLVPGEAPGVHQQRAVGLPVGDVAGQVVVVALSVEHPSQQRHLGVRGQ